MFSLYIVLMLDVWLKCQGTRHHDIDSSAVRSLCQENDFICHLVIRKTLNDTDSDSSILNTSRVLYAKDTTVCSVTA